MNLVSKRQRDPVKENKSLIRAKRTAVATSLTSGALGLGSLGALGASAALKRPEIARQVATRVPKLKNTADVSRKLGSAAVVGTTASAGIGGAGSLNFAGVQAKEARKLKEETMRKSYTPGLDFGTSGVHQGENVEIIEKRNKRFDGEKKRERRLELYSQGSTAAGGGLLTGAGVMGAKAVGQKPGTRWKPTKPGSATYQATDFAGTGLRSTQKAQWLKGAKQAGKAGAVGLTGVGALVAGDRIKQYRKGKGRAWS